MLLLYLGAPTKPRAASAKETLQMFTGVNAMLLASLLHRDSEMLDTCLSTTSVQSEGKAD